ncbi:hypothetical protein NQ035_07675 [Staphylococcus gallinarum]|jgi:hypothetical protein|uniref:hypothetical protein n=1 Tax=Staphylococcus gallinarum TaxID=1293 RepID=UPI000D1C536D|nr:hypothetical protein [Staphylococcus gallinarum]MCQ9288747.1 hypothetical protein [Staphylococcus gallinarum]PTE36548.1 hypothetical protein BUZ00_04830 [Staphylococcus gallinarum]
MKIKTKKQLNLPQLIEWAWDNDVKGETFYARETGMENVHFNTSGRAEFSDVHQFSSDDYFTVEVEEEVTEDTKLGKAIEVYSGEYDNFLATSFEGRSVKDILDSNVGNDTKTEKIYLFNVDDTMTLIWRDGKLVE